MLSTSHCTLKQVIKLAGVSMACIHNCMVHGSSRGLCSILIVVSHRHLLSHWDTEWCTHSTLLNCCTWYCTFLQWCHKTPIRGNHKTTYAQYSEWCTCWVTTIGVSSSPETAKNNSYVLALRADAHGLSGFERLLNILIPWFVVDHICVN